MFIASTVNAKSVSASDLPVVVLTYRNRSYLVKATEKYEDIADMAIKVFGIEDRLTSVVFETSTLDICQGRAVRIHKSAWESIRNLVSEIRVSVAEEADDARGQKALDEPPTVPSSSKQPQGQVLAANQAHLQQELGDIVHPRVIDDQAVADKNDLEDEDEAEQLAALSSFAASVADSDYSDENPISEGDILAAENVVDEHLEDRLGPDNRSLTAGPEFPDEEEERDPMNEDLIDYEAPAVHAVKAEPEGSELAHLLARIIEGDFQGAINADPHVADRPIKKEKMRYSPEPRQEVIVGGSQQSQSQEESTSRFIINIEHRPSAQVLMFKTRGEHTVGKVLSKACKEFELDYDSAALKLIVEIEGEEGGEILSECDRNDTMARAGAVKDARFIIVADDD